MAAVAFVLLAGVGVGSVAFHVGMRAAIGVALLGPLGAVLLDAAGILWRARGALGLGRPPSGPVAGEPRPVGEEPVLPVRVLWLILRDTFEVSFVVIALVGGLTYAVLVTVAVSLHLVSG